jgi:hypothetical protein
MTQFINGDAERQRMERENRRVQAKLEDEVHDHQRDLKTFRSVLRWLITGQLGGGVMVILGAMAASSGGGVATIVVGLLLAIVCFGWTIWWVIEAHYKQTYKADLEKAQRELNRFLEDPDQYPRSRY